ncbi:MAG: arginine--tRNA ligase [Lachnospiraceae bacterium]|nr:arginine--tRNA ligase [Lachnospiraceae bacterium]
MKKILDILTNEVARAFESAGYDEKYAKVTVSNRPDLCQFQCNGAMAAVKEYKKAPLVIAQDVADKLAGSACFKKAEAVKPGFINLDLDDEALKSYIEEMAESPKYGIEAPAEKEKIIVDYGGPNVAKPLHIGHLRAAIIGESVKRIANYAGHDTLGDIHLGDWGLQMGLIIAYMKENDMDLPTLSELEKIYPAASAKSADDEDFKKKAMDITYELQHGNEEYTKIWQHIMKISVEDLKKNYEKLSVFFEIWKGESDAQPFIDPMVEKMKEDGFAHESQGALVVDVNEESDTKEIPPCMILKSDNASLYTTTDLATLVQRMKDYDPKRVIYVVDKRQDLHFVQVFRCAKKTGIVPEDVKLIFLGFGTMNGADGKPFKTRSGGVMRLETLLSDVYDKCYERMKENGGEMSEDERKDTASKIALAAIKYGDLSNQASKDYIFDIDKFTSFEGNTGPYILYTIVRIKSILRKYEENGGKTDGCKFIPPVSDSERGLLLLLTGYNAMMQGAFEETAPHRVCAYIYELANAFNHFYHETKILAEEDEKRKESYISLLLLTKGILEDSIGVLGFEAPEKM